MPDDAGLYARIKGLAATFVAAGRSRLELLGNEYELEKRRLFQLLLLGQALLFSLLLAIFLLTTLVALLFWEHRLFVFAFFAVLFLGLAGFFFFSFRRVLFRASPVFASSLAELAEDLRQLKAALNHEQNPD